MQLLFLCCPPQAGKLTIGRIATKRTGLPLSTTIWSSMPSAIPVRIARIRSPARAIPA
jgi:hypothetical protein